MELSELLEQIDIVEYISQYIELTQKGEEWWGLSCFKDENTPSFSVRRQPPVFFDYSSGIGGNLYTFIRYHDRCSRREAIEKLKEYAGFDGKVSAKALAEDKLSATMVCRKFSPPQTREKPSKTTVLADDFMDRYESRPEKLQVWRDEGITDAVLDKFLVRYDSFSDRIVYPVRDTSGKIVNIGGRTLDPAWKEKKLPKYCYFYSWGTMQTIYGLAENRSEILRKNEIILFEGCKSVLKAASWGIENTGAILTSHLNPSQMKILAKLGCNVVFALDKEIDIRKDHNIAKLKNYVNVSFLCDTENLLDEKDSPVDRGEEVFRRLYDRRSRYR